MFLNDYVFDTFEDAFYSIFVRISEEADPSIDVDYNYFFDKLKNFKVIELGQERNIGRNITEEVVKNCIVSKKQEFKNGIKKEIEEINEKLKEMS